MNDNEKIAIYEAMKFITCAMDRLVAISRESYEKLFNEINNQANETQKTQK